ncbi:MAG: type II toxin-antitoxin system PemK/MazF family toxin [Bacteroidetes bacterium]|nr:type II toxin-antitoxin system PemK/MazF family toxin [Bacteroidota bacterium]
MKRGTIVLTPFPFTDLSSKKVRPAVIVSSDKRNDTDLIIAFISSVFDLNNFHETSIILDSNDSYFPETGLKMTSIIRVDKLATVEKKIILGELGSLDNKLISLLNSKLKIVLGIDN